MNRICKAEFIAPGIKRFVIEAPRIASKRKAGQFVIVRTHKGGERIPLTIVDSDRQRNTITLIVQGAGKSTKELNRLQEDDFILDVVGPLGKPSEIEYVGTALVIGGGVGTAIAYPIAAALKKAGNRTISMIGARNKNLLILEEDLRNIADEVYVTTDDGSAGFHGLVTELVTLLLRYIEVDLVVAIGPIPMMKAIAETTRPYGIKTIVSLNPIMVDGTGMCGGCRAVVDKKTVFVCVDGPEFNAHQVDFDLLRKRNLAYQRAERAVLEKFECGSQKQLAGALP